MYPIQQTNSQGDLPDIFDRKRQAFENELKVAVIVRKQADKTSFVSLLDIFGTEA